MKCIFVSDLHGNKKKIKKLFEIIEKEQPKGVFIGGDILPNTFQIKEDIESFLREEIFLRIEKIREKTNKKTRFFVILGNDDPRVYEKILIEADKNKTIDYICEKTVSFNDLYVTGYPYVPPTPFQLKDWEKYDVSRFVDVGAASPEEGIRTIEVEKDFIRYSTISEDLMKLSNNSDMRRTVFLFHSPPYKSNLDRAALDGKYVDNAPLDVHVGSVAIQRFIDAHQPLLTLHGHVHESYSLTGEWMEKKGKTISLSAAYNGPELLLIRFDTKDIYNPEMELIEV